MGKLMTESKSSYSELQMVFWAGFLRLLSPHLQSLPSPSLCYTHFSSDHAFSLQRLCICCLLCLEISPPQIPTWLASRSLSGLYSNVIFLVKLFLDTLCNILHPPLIFPILLPYVIFFPFGDLPPSKIIYLFWIMSLKNVCSIIADFWSVLLTAESPAPLTMPDTY